MKTYLELLIIELGWTDQPLQAPYNKVGSWTTDSWLKRLWEKCLLFDIKVEFHDIPIGFAHTGDRWLMREFKRLGYGPEELPRLNRVRLYQQVVFLSDVVGASGRSRDPKYLRPRERGDKWSKLLFPLEKPPAKDFQL